MSRTPFVLLAAMLFAVASASCSRTATGPRGEPWRFLPGHVEAFSLAGFREGRQCWVYLPPGYATTDARYPVLYFNDGENAFDGGSGMHMNRIAEDLIRRGEMEPIIIVAITSGPVGMRFYDYTPWLARSGYRTGGGDLYLRAVRDTLKPAIDARYRTLPDREHTAMGGYSLGGLISTYALFAYDSTFARAGSFSPSYGYGADFSSFVLAHWRNFALMRLYHDTGAPDDNDIAWVDYALLRVGFVMGVDLMSVTAVGGEHDFASWEHRMPDMLRFVFPRSL